MNTKKKFLVFLLVAVMLALQVVPASAQDKTPPFVEVTLSDGPSNEDENWPVIKTETRKRKDLSAGQEIVETIVVRQEPPTKDKTACKEKHKNRTDQAIIQAATCIVNRYSVVKQTQVSVGGGSLTGYVKNIADEYCSSTGGCGFYKMKRLDVWWTRTATNFGVINAIRTWGCTASCIQCSGSPTSYVWQSVYFNPTWNGLKSATYTRTSSAMPIMRAMPEFGGYPVGGVDFIATAPRSQTPVSVYTIFFDG